MFFLNRNNTDVLVALEVGTSKVVAAVAELRPDGTLTLLGVGEVPSSGVRKGEVVDFADAQACIRQAIHKAEKETDVEIREVSLALTGQHIKSRTDSVRTVICEEDRIITPMHLDELRNLAEHLGIPRDHAFIFLEAQQYYLDHHTPVKEPVGQVSQTLEGRYHLAYGVKTRFLTTARCVGELGVTMSRYVLGSYAMANAVLDQEARKQGSVAIDLGAGATSYIVYVDDAVVHSGVIGVGGDHLTQDLSVGLRLTYLKAEMLKKQHGDLFTDGHPIEDRILIEKDVTSEERWVYRESMARILHARQREILQLVEEDLDLAGLWPHLHGGVFLTGGASQMRGVQRLAQEVFPVPVTLAHDHAFLGSQAYSKRPDLSSVLGLLLHAQECEMASPRQHGWKRIRESVMNFLSSMGLF